MGHRPFFEASCITGRREASITVVPGAQFFVGGAVRSAVTRAPRRATDSRPYAARIGGAAGDDGLPRSSGDQSPGACRAKMSETSAILPSTPAMSFSPRVRDLPHVQLPRSGDLLVPMVVVFSQPQEAKAQIFPLHKQPVRPGPTSR